MEFIDSYGVNKQEIGKVGTGEADKEETQTRT